MVIGSHGRVGTGEDPEAVLALDSEVVGDRRHL